MPAARFRLGRLPGKIPVGLRDLTFYAAGALPAAPPSVAVPHVADWGMLGNDTWGDCGVAGFQHNLESASAAAGESEAFPTADQVVSYYLDYTGGQDSGVVLSDFLAHVKQDGFYGHTVQAYAPVSVSDVNTLRFAIDAYGASYVGITVTQAMMDAAQGNPPWTWTLDDMQGDPIGGHCIILAGYDSNWLYGITWGAVVEIAWPAWHQMGDEAWAILSGELARGDGRGIDLAALQADLSRLTT